MTYCISPMIYCIFPCQLSCLCNCSGPVNCVHVCSPSILRILWASFMWYFGASLQTWSFIFLNKFLYTLHSVNLSHFFITFYLLHQNSVCVFACAPKRFLYRPARHVLLGNFTIIIGFYSNYILYKFVGIINIFQMF